MIPPRVILFGSRAKSGTCVHADFDFAVESKRPSISVQRKITDDMESISGLYKVDVVYMSSVYKDECVKTIKDVLDKSAFFLTK